VSLASGNYIVFSHFADFKAGIDADTWLSTGAWGDDIAAEHRNEGPCASNDQSSPISLTSTKTGREKRRVAAAKKRAADTLDAFDVKFEGPKDR